MVNTTSTSRLFLVIKKHSNLKLKYHLSDSQCQKLIKMSTENTQQYACLMVQMRSTVARQCQLSSCERNLYFFYVLRLTKDWDTIIMKTT